MLKNQSILIPVLINSTEKFYFLNFFALMKISYLKLKTKNQYCRNKLIFLFLNLFFFKY